jgi:hypothetical protein
MSKNNYKKVEFQINDVSASNFLCGENLLSYVKSNLSIDGNYVLVVKYISLYQSIVLKSNKFLDYSFLSSYYDRILIGLYDSCYNIITNDIVSKVGCSKKELDSYIDSLDDSDLYYMELFCVVKYLVLKDYNNNGYCHDYDNLDINYDNITMYFIPVDNYTEEVLDNIIKRYDV